MGIKFQLILGIIGEGFAILVGILLMAMGSIGLGLLFFLSGIILFPLNIMKLQKLNKYQSFSRQDMDSVPELQEPVTVSIVKISDWLRGNKYSVFSNDVKVGEIRYGEVLKFDVTKEKSLLKVGTGDTPFRTRGYLFDATENYGYVELEITSSDVGPILQRIED